MRVYVTRYLTDGAMARIHELDAEVEVHPSAEEPPDRSELLERAKGCDAILAMVTDRVDGELLDAAGPQLRVVANHAVGVDNVDLPAAAQREVVITNTPGVLTEATADMAFGLLLAAARRIAEADRFLRSGADWQWSPRMLVGFDVSAGRTLGIVGLGRIGMAVARRARAFHLRVQATGSGASSPEAAELGVRPVELDELLETSDVVSLHCPLTSDTRHLIGADALARMKPDAILVNTSRGPVVDEEALVEALSTGGIRAAGLDVFEDEPRLHPRLRELDNVVLTPHIGSAADVSRDRMGIIAADNIAAVLAGREPFNPVEA